MQQNTSEHPPILGSSLYTLLLALSVLVAGTAAPARAQDATVEDFYFSYEGEVSVSIALDKVGVLPAQGVTNGEIEEFADNNGLEVVRRLRGQIYILGLPSPRTRSELVAFARDLRQTNEDVGQAGLVVSRIWPSGEKAGTPMVLTDQFVAKFDSDLTRSEIESLNADRGVEIVMDDPAADNVFLLRVTSNSGRDALDMANLYHEETQTEFGEPNFVVVHETQQTIPNDPLFNEQWHHRNTGQNGGTPDADLDTPLAWDVTTGDQNTVVAVLDNGFDPDQADVVPNLWQNPGETAGNGMDDDGNGYDDDVNGWAFEGCTTNAGAGCGSDDVASPDDDGDGMISEDWFDFSDNDGDGSSDEDGGAHGTATAGAVAAEGDNGTGVSGTCPDCRLMLLRWGPSYFAMRLAFQYARQNGADIVSNSWGYNPAQRPNTVVSAINNAAQSGIPILFSLTNGPYSDDCGNGVSTLPNVFSIGASNNLDMRSPSGYGDCMEMVAPTYQGRQFAVGTLGAVTTDAAGQDGYNTDAATGSTCMTSSGTVSNFTNTDYNACFGGTSFATPITAGVAGLLLSADPNLTRQEVQRLLQDTGNKIQDSMAVYDPETGFSDPSSGPSGGLPATSSHGFGRVNAAEAVRVADQGVDVFLRDNRLDWGNTQRRSSHQFPSGFINWWESVDVKVDAPPYQLSSSANASDFANLKNEDPISGLKNRVYVRVRNRGPSAASNVKVTLRYGFAGTSLPRWPSGWGSSQTIGQKTISTVPYSGSSVAGGTSDPAQVVQFDWTAPAPKTGQPSPNHFCLLTELSGVSADPSSPPSGPLRNVVPTENNFSLNNVSVVNTTTTVGVYADSFYVANPYDQAIETEVTLNVPEGWDVALANVPSGQPFTLDEGERRLAVLRVYPPTAVLNGEETGTVEVMQEALFGENERQDIGGLTYRYRQSDGLLAGSGLTVPGDGLFDFGNPHGLDILFDGVTQTGAVVVRRFNDGPSDESGIEEGNVSDYRFLIDTPETEEGLLDFENAELRFDVSRLAGIENPEGVTIYSRPEGGTWSPLETNYNSSSGTLSAPVSDFSEFVFASDADPLPVEMAAFDATVTDEASVELSWTTASETGNAGFRIQRRAADGGAGSSQWTTIGRVEGRGTADASTSYSFVDEDLPYAADSLSYRLKQVDADGTTSFTAPVTVQRGVSAVTLLGTFPNPASQQVTLRYALPRAQSVRIGLYDVLGREVRTIVQGRREGRQEVQIDVSDLSSGVYVLRLKAGETVKTKRLTVAR